MSFKVIDTADSLNFISDYNVNGTNGNSRVTFNIDGTTTFYNTQESINSSTGSILTYGGLAINSGINATSSSQGGALTVNGGAAISADLYIGGNLFFSGVDSSNTLAYLTLTATDPSSNFTSGALLSFGGITVQTTEDAVSSTSGGSITLAGGLGVAKNAYIGNTLFAQTGSFTNANITNATISNFQLNSVSVSNATLGSLFANNNKIGINKTAPTLGVLDILGNIFVSSTAENTFTSSVSGTPVIKITNTNSSGGSEISFNDQLYIGSGGVAHPNFQNIGYINSVSGIPLKIVAGNITSNPVIFNASDNSVNITCTTAAMNTSSGALKVSGGLSVEGNVYIGGTLVTNTTVSTGPSNSSTEGSLVLQGGLSINILDTTNANSTSYTRGGGITIAGGAAVSSDFYLGGIIDIKSNGNNGNPMKFQSIQINTNYNSGSATIIQSGNASRTSNSFTPIQFAGYNDQSNPKFSINAGNVNSILPFVASFNTNTIGSLFTTGGNVGINNTAPSVTLDITGGMKVSGSLAIGTSVELFSGTASLGNNTTGVIRAFNTYRSFEMNLTISVVLSIGSNMYARYTIYGLQTASGWYLDVNYIGDDTGIVFSINNGTGDFSYTSSLISNWTSTTIVFQGNTHA